MGLSADPAKRRRQLEALERGAQARAATLRARIEELDPIDAASEDRPAPLSEDRIEAASEDRPPAGVIVAGVYPEPPAPPPNPDPERVPEPGPGPEPEPEPEPVEEHVPGWGTRVAAAALGVRPER